jgi:hypothetical protein
LAVLRLISLWHTTANIFAVVVLIKETFFLIPVVVVPASENLLQIKALAAFLFYIHFNESDVRWGVERGEPHSPARCLKKLLSNTSKILCFLYLCAIRSITFQPTSSI